MKGCTMDNKNFVMGGEEQPISLINRTGKVKVSFCNLGEGLCEEYRPDDPNDINFLRFDVYRREGEDWEPVDDASYNTDMPAGTNIETLKKALDYIMYYVQGDVESGISIKKLCQKLSWISPNFDENLI